MSAVIEAIHYLHQNGSLALWSDLREGYGHLMAPEGQRTGGATWRQIQLVCLDHWPQIDRLLQGHACNHCGVELEFHEQRGEPICFSCFMDGITERPSFIRDFMRTREQMLLQKQR